MIYTLKNTHWSVQIAPELGASIVSGQAYIAGGFSDVLRPAADYANPSNASSFIMLPWCNRIRDGLLRFDGQVYPVATAKDDGTARHGEVRRQVWDVVDVSDTHIVMRTHGGADGPLRWPFAYAAEAEYRLDGEDFVWVLRLTNVDTRPMPAGFGHHPYFSRRGQTPILTVPCSRQFVLKDFMAISAPIPVTSALDFRQGKPLDEATEYNDLLTERDVQSPISLYYPDDSVMLEMRADSIFGHILVYTPAGEPYVAVEPQSNANDGFSLYEEGVAGSGVFVVGAGETVTGTVSLRVRQVMG
jgi:aldose 1-epimerase